MFACVAFGLATCGLFLEVAAWNMSEFSAKSMRFYWFRLTDFAVPLAAAVFAGTLIAISAQLSKRGQVVYLVVALAIAGWHLADVMNAQRIDPHPRGDTRLAQNGDGRDIAGSGSVLDRCLPLCPRANAAGRAIPNAAP